MHPGYKKQTLMRKYGDLIWAGSDFYRFWVHLGAKLGVGLVKDGCSLVGWVRFCVHLGAKLGVGLVKA